MEVGALFGRFIWRGINIYDVTIHPSRGSRINPTLKMCEHNRAAHASCAQIKLWIMTVPNWAINMNVQANRTKKINKMNVTHNLGYNPFQIYHRS